MFSRPRDVSIFRPHAIEATIDPLLCVLKAPDLELVRVAKWLGEVVAVYQLTQMTETEFALVSIHIEAAYRRKGLGTWMLGHAIGLAEARGGRSIEAAFAEERRFFERRGFNPRKNGVLRLEVQPE